MRASLQIDVDFWHLGTLLLTHPTHKRYQNIIIQYYHVNKQKNNPDKIVI